MNQAFYERHLAAFYRARGGNEAVWGEAALLSVHKKAQELARHGNTQHDFQRTAGFREFLGRVSFTAEKHTVDVPEVVVRKAINIGGNIMFSFLPPWTKLIVSMLIVGVSGAAGSGYLGQDTATWIIGLLTALGVTPTSNTKSDIKPDAK